MKAREAFSRGDLLASKTRFATVLRSNPESSAAHFGLGMVLLAQGGNSEALSEFLLALRYDPSSVETLAWATITCLNLRDGERAEEFARKLVRLQPRNDRAYFLLSNSLSLQGRLDDALESTDRALAIQPMEPDFVTAKAQILGRLNWSSQAIEWYRKAIKLRPTPELYIELAEALIREGQVHESISMLEQIMPTLPPQTGPHQLLAQAYTEAQEFSSAAIQWSIAEKLTANKSELLLTRANSEIYAGRLDVAEDLLQEALDHDPTAARLYQPLTAIRKMTGSDERLIDNMERLLAGGTLEYAVEGNLRYALGKAYNDLGQFRQAMQSYDEANRIEYELSPVSRAFNPEAWKSYTDLQIEYFTADRIKSLVRDGLDADSPLFIMGMIRSGTTLAEQILSRHPMVSAGGETTFWPDHRGEVLNADARRFDTVAGRRLGQAFLRIQSRLASNVQYVSEKNPSIVLIAGIIHCVFPNAKLLHIKRHPIDNLLSIWMTPIQTGLPFVYHRENLVFVYREYARLLQHLQHVLPEDRFKSFDYENITAEPVPTIVAMLRFLDLEPESDCFHPEGNSRTVRTPSYYQVRQPINTDSQARWKKYEPWLGTFADLLNR